MTFHLSEAILHSPRKFAHLKRGYREGQFQSGYQSSDEEDDFRKSAFDSTSLVTSQVAIAEDLPDASRANRRPPEYANAIHIATKTQLHCIAVYRSSIVTGHGGKLKLHQVGEEEIESQTCHLTAEQDKKEFRLSALAFKPVSASSEVPNGLGLGGGHTDAGRYLWCGTKDGVLMEFDRRDSCVTFSRGTAHTAAVIFMERVGDRIISLDESGKICLWLPKSDKAADVPSSSGLDLRQPPITQRIVLDKYAYPFMVGEQLWVATAVEPTSSSSLPSPRLRVYQPFSEDKPFNAVSRPSMIPDSLDGRSVGLVTCGAAIPARKDVVYMGHQTGHISIWSRSTYSCVAIQRVARHITAMAGVGTQLWTGDKQGGIKVYDVSSAPWKVLKEWSAHDGPIMSIFVDPTAIDDGKLHIVSSSTHGQIHLWDGLLASDWLLEKLELREAEYSTYRDISALLFSYNIDAKSPEDFRDQTFPNLATVFAQAEPPDLLVLALQELVKLDDTKIVARSFLFGGARRGKGKGVELGDRISHQYRLWCDLFADEIRKHAPVPYTMVVTDNLVGLFTCVFVRDKEMGNVSNARIASVKTGFGGRIGNKGGIAASLTIDDTSLAFVNCHLAAGHRKIRHRNADLVDILDCSPFSGRSLTLSEAFTGGGDGSMILDHRVVILSGDLNYRIDLSRANCFELIANRNYAGLLAKDQLYKEMRENPAFRLRHFKEAAITFLPTYKYRPLTNEWDPSEKQRVPSYCDRILWHCRKEGIVECAEYKRLEYLPSDHRPISARFKIKVKRSNIERKAVVIRDLQTQWKSVQADILLLAREWYS